MSFVVTDACIRCKYTDCVDACPVDCFHGGAVMVVIDPVVCIDCAACVPACPSDAIVEGSKPASAPWLELNRRFSGIWPQMLEHRSDFPDADRYKGQPGKFERYFSEQPQGD
ncbi:MAG: DUF3470 domain-containing protein [Panacagrimonas sp.]